MHTEFLQKRLLRELPREVLLRDCPRRLPRWIAQEIAEERLLSRRLRGEIAQRNHPERLRRAVAQVEYRERLLNNTHREIAQLDCSEKLSERLRNESSGLSGALRGKI